MRDSTVSNVIYIPGGVEVAPDEPIHILTASKKGPYRRFCTDDEANANSRAVGVTARIVDFCPACLTRYVRYRADHGFGAPFSDSAPDMVDGLHVVAIDARWTAYSVDSMLPPSASADERREWFSIFRAELKALARDYGFTVDWDSRSGWLLADRRDNCTRWGDLYYVAAERARAALSAHVRAQLLASARRGGSWGL